MQIAGLEMASALACSSTNQIARVITLPCSTAAMTSTRSGSGIACSTPLHSILSAATNIRNGNERRRGPANEKLAKKQSPRDNKEDGTLLLRLASLCYDYFVFVTGRHMPNQNRSFTTEECIVIGG